MNNSKERGYIFQDAFSSYIISDYINRILNGEYIDTRVVLDKKSNIEDKFDDLKIIEKDIVKEIQIKYSETKEILDWSDFKNASSDYNLYQFINSYKGSKNNKNILIIRNTSGNISMELEKKLLKKDSKGFFLQSRLYKIKNEEEIINELFDCRIIKSNKERKQPFKNITKDDIKDFIDNFIIEVTNQGLGNDDFGNLILNSFDSGVIGYAKGTNQSIYNTLLNTIRTYRAEDNYVEKQINEISNEIMKALGLEEYLSPVSNKMEIDELLELRRSDDINNIINLLKENNLLHIYGAPGVGKSWLSKQLKDKIEENSLITTYYFYFNRNDEERSKRIKEINFLTTLNYNLQKKHGFNINLFNNDINSIIDQANKDDKIHYLLLDGIDHIEREDTDQKIVIKELLKSLTQIANSTEKMKIILISQPIDEIDVKCKYEIKNFHIEETKIIVEKFCKKYDLDINISIEEIHKKTNGNPLLINYLMREYMNKGNIPANDFDTLDEYYDYIFEGLQFYLYMYFAILQFPVTANELAELSKTNYTEVNNEIGKIKNVLTKNERNEYMIFHESLKRYILKNPKIETNLLKNNLIDWLNSLDIYENEKAFNYLPELIVNTNNFLKFNKEYNIDKLINCIFEKGISIKEIEKFNVCCYKIFSLREEFEKIYYIEHFSNILNTYQYEVDLDIFEDYIRILYLRGEKELLEKILYKRGLIKYANHEQEWEYIRKICIYLLKNNVKLNYENIINIYFENYNKKDLIKIDKLIIPKNEIGIMVNFIKLNSEKKDKILEEIGRNDNRVKATIKKFIEGKLDGYNTKLLEYGVLVPDKKIDIEIIKGKYKKQKYISNIDENILAYFFNNEINKNIEYLNNVWEKEYLEIPKFYKLLVSLIEVFTNTELKNNKSKFEEIFDKLNYSDLNFEGNIINSEEELDFLGNLFVKNENNNYIIIKFMEFYEKMKKEKTNRHEGILPFLGSIYKSIVYNIKKNNIKLEIDTLRYLFFNIDSRESNYSNLRNLMTNYIMLYLVNGDQIEIYKEIKCLMFSYGSYRDIQIWELIDIYDRLKEEKLLDKEKFLKLYTIAYNAIERMDRAKDVWHILNELLEKYAKDFSAEEAMKIFFYTMEISYNGIRDEDILFSEIYENIKLKDYKKNKFLYYYWRYISGNIQYSINNRNSYLKSCIKFATNKQYNYIKKEIIENIKINQDDIIEGEIEKVINNKKKFMEYEKNEEKNEKEKKRDYIYIDNFNDFISKINDTYLSVHDIAYESICKIINSLPEEEEIINKILTIKQYTSINYIYNILLKNSYNFSTSNKNKLVPFLVGLYYRGNGNVTNMENDEIYEKCIAMDRDMAEKVLKKYFKKDEEYQIGNKAGKLYKYLIKKEHISCVYENLITMYNERLPQLIDFTNDYYSNYNLGDKNDILLNYFMLKLKENERRFPSTVDELLFVNLYDVKCNKNFFIKNDKAIFLALTVYAIYLSDLWLMKNSFLNWNRLTEKNIIVCEINQNKTSINMNMENCTNAVKKKIISNPRGLLAMNGYESYKYVSNMFQLFDIYGGIEDRNIIKREYKIGRNGRIKYLMVKQQNNNKLKKLAEIQNIYKIRSMLEEFLF